MNVLIAGCGYVGSALAERLLAAGHAVWGIRRNVDALPPGVTPVVVDLLSGAGLGAVPGHPDVVLYAVAGGGKADTDYHALYAGGLRRLVDQLAACGASPRRLVFVSSTGVYGRSDGGWVDEDTPTGPALASGRAMLAAEAVARAAPWSSLAVRFGGIYGPGRTRLIRSLERGDATCPRDPPRYLNQIHRDDCAGVLEHALTADAVDDVWVATDSEPAPRWDVLQWLAGKMNVPGPREWTEADGDYPGADRANKRCSNARLLASGYEFIYPTFREGYGALLRG